MDIPRVYVYLPIRRKREEITVHIEVINLNVKSN